MSEIIDNNKLFQPKIGVSSFLLLMPLVVGEINMSSDKRGFYRWSPPVHGMMDNNNLFQQKERFLLMRPFIVEL